tara:strand:- start:1464 stop:2147 length:684 start_codon:yes stop_codon:yes gene_type:complete
MNAVDSILNATSSSGFAELDLFSVIFNFIMCVLMSFIARLFYIKYSTSLTGKHHIGTVIPILSTIVFLVILIVKSSLALSLGLVGALSIVRFRTPIKEPEELVYLFLSIAIGLGYAAGYTFLTTIITLAILGMIFLWLSNRKIDSKNEYNLILSWENESISFERITNEIMEISSSLKLIRFNKGPLNKTASFMIVPNNDVNLDKLIERIGALDRNIEVNFYESKTNW